jgi:mono/diheme cytochrome c family protein
MTGRAAILLVLAGLLAGCNLAGDITPPPALATAQAAAPVPATSEATSAAAPTSSSPATQAPADVPAPAGIDTARGRVIWTEKCAPCHGETGQSDGVMTANLPSPPPQLGSAELARAARPADWYAVVTNGRIDRLMPAFASLSDAERWDVVAYALSLGSPAADVQAGEALYAENACAQCHGDGQGGGGGGPSFRIPGLVQQRSLDDLAQAIRAGSPPAMPSYGETLTDDQVWALASYVRTLAWSSPGAEQPSTPAALQSGSIGGRVINGTAGASLPQGLEVILTGFDGEQEVYRQTASVASDGSYAFTDLPAVAGRIYGATVSYAGVLYFSEGAHLAGDGAPLDLPITIHDTTTDATALSIERLHILFDFTLPERVQVLELWVLSNRSDRTIVAPPGGAAVEAALPEGATDLGFEQGSIGDRFMLTESGFGDTQPVIPGTATSQFIFSYVMPYDGRLDFRRPTDYAVEAVVLLLPAAGVTAEGSGLQDLGVQQMGGQSVHSYASGAISAGGALELELSGKPAAESVGAPSSGLTNIAIGIGVLGGLLIVAGLWWFRPNRAGRPGRETRPPPAPEADRLIDEIADLDDAFAAGGMEESVYRARRESLKRLLRDRMR